MSDFLLFLGKFLRHGTKIASLAPSSPWLSRATVRPIDWGTARVVVELGAGTGPITKVLAESAPPSCRVLALERDPDFARLLRERFGGPPSAAAGVRELRAPMPGLVLSVGVAPGDRVTAGTPLLVLEAMKMENEIRADAEGTVRTVHVRPGDAVTKGTPLVEFEP